MKYKKKQDPLFLVNEAKSALEGKKKKALVCSCLGEISRFHLELHLQNPSYWLS